MSRVMRWVMGVVLLAAWCGSALAIVPTVPSYYYYRNAAPSISYPSYQAACQAYQQVIQSQFPTRQVTIVHCAEDSDPLTKVRTYVASSGFEQFFTDQVTKQSSGPVCPANSTPNGVSSCSCTAPYVEDSSHTSCVMPPSVWEQRCNAVSAQSAGPGDWPGTSSVTGCAPVPGGGTAQQGCLVTGSGTGVKYQPSPGNWITSNSNTTYTGATCVPNVDAPSSVKDPCPNGQSGTVNGKSRCVPLDPTIPAEQTRDNVVVNPDGSTTTTTETTSCNGAKCTTTTSSTTTGGSGAGNGTSTSSTTEGIGEYCKKNPQTALCAKTNNGQSATTGDDKSDGECDNKSTVIGCAKFGTPPADQQIPKDTKTVGLGVSPVQGFGAVCPAPSSFTVYGQTFTISYTPLCDKASLIKPLILLVAAFISLGIVYSALKGA